MSAARRYNVSFHLPSEMAERIEAARAAGLLGSEPTGTLARRLLLEHLGTIDGGEPTPAVVRVADLVPETKSPWLTRQELIEALRLTAEDFNRGSAACSGAPDQAAILSAVAAGIGEIARRLEQT